MTLDHSFDEIDAKLRRAEISAGAYEAIIECSRALNKAGMREASDCLLATYKPIVEHATARAMGALPINFAEGEI